MVKKAAEARPNYLLLAARKERNWTQKEVADRIGAPQSFLISRWEQGIAFPSTYYIQKLCLLFGKSAKELGVLVPRQVFSGFKRSALRLGRHNQSKLVGRDRELDTMRQFLLALEQAPQQGSKRAGYPYGEKQDNNPPTIKGEQELRLIHFLFLTGESGIGKTRLAEELSYEANLRDWSVVWTHAYEQERTIPYRPWTDILRILMRFHHAWHRGSPLNRSACMYGKRHQCCLPC